MATNLARECTGVRYPEQKPACKTQRTNPLLKRKRLTIEEVLEAIDIYLQIPVRFVEVELTKSLELADEMNLYAYDAYLLRCAAKYRLPLLTLDSRLAEAARGKKVQVLEVEE